MFTWHVWARAHSHGWLPLLERLIPHQSGLYHTQPTADKTHRGPGHNTYTLSVFISDITTCRDGFKHKRGVGCPKLRKKTLAVSRYYNFRSQPALCNKYPLSVFSPDTRPKTGSNRLPQAKSPPRLGPKAKTLTRLTLAMTQPDIRTETVITNLITYSRFLNFQT